MYKILGAIGFILLILGTALIDSEYILLPAAMLIGGLILCAYAAREDDIKQKKGKTKWKN